MRGDREQIRESSWNKFAFAQSFGRHGTFGKSRATRCQSLSLLRCLATSKTSKRRNEKMFSKGHGQYVRKATGQAVYDVEARSVTDRAPSGPSSYWTIIITDHRTRTPNSLPGQAWWAASRSTKLVLARNLEFLYDGPL